MAPKKTTAAKKAPVKKAITKKAAPAKKASVAKKAAPAKKASAAKKAPAKKATTKTPVTKKASPVKKAAPAKKAVAKKKSPAKVKKGVDLVEFTQVLYDVCKLLVLSCKTDEIAPQASKACKLTDTFDFSVAKKVINLLPEDARYPMMIQAQSYIREMQFRLDYEDSDLLDYEDTDSDEVDEETEEDDEDAERTAAILKEYAQELEDEDDDGFLFSAFWLSHANECRYVWII